MIVSRMKLFFLLFLFLSLPSASAWTWPVHTYMCPDMQTIDCREADKFEFQRDYPYGNEIHLCYDNNPNCMPRLVAKYYVKKYFVEGKKDTKLLGAAAHLLQDAATPDHWFPMREFFGRIFVPFAPAWVGTMEGRVDSALQGNAEWNIPIEFQGNVVNINKEYLERQKENIRQFLSKEPAESLEEIEQQINARLFWTWLRGFKEWIYVWIIIAAVTLAYGIWDWKRAKKKKFRKIDFVILSVFMVAVLILLGLIMILY